MSYQTFTHHANDSILFAQFAAESAGIAPAQIELWLRVFAARSIA